MQIKKIINLYSVDVKETHPNVYARTILIIHIVKSNSESFKDCVVFNLTTSLITTEKAVFSCCVRLNPRKKYLIYAVLSGGNRFLIMKDVNLMVML